MRVSAGELYWLGPPLLHLEMICAYSSGLCSPGKETNLWHGVKSSGGKSHPNPKAALTINHLLISFGRKTCKLSRAAVNDSECTECNLTNKWACISMWSHHTFLHPLHCLTWRREKLAINFFKVYKFWGINKTLQLTVGRKTGKVNKLLKQLTDKMQELSRMQKHHGQRFSFPFWLKLPELPILCEENSPLEPARGWLHRTANNSFMPQLPEPEQNTLQHRNDKSNNK